MNSNYIDLHHLLPSLPSKIRTKDLHDRRADTKHIRTTQRHLEQMETLNLAVKTIEGSVHFWSRPTKGSAMDFGMTLPHAFALKMAEPLMEGIIPNSLQRELSSLSERAQLRLEIDEGKTAWQNKFVLEAASFPPSRETIDESVRESILEALLNDESLQIKYERAGRKINWRIVFPYGIIQSKNTQYLVAATLTPFEEGETYWKSEHVSKDNLRTFALHRVREVKPSTQPFQKIEDFDLNSYSESGVTHFKIGFKDIDVVLIAKGMTANILKNAELSEKIEDSQSNHTTKFTFKTAFTYQFVRWCMAHANDLFILEPAELKEEIGKLWRDPRQPF